MDEHCNEGSGDAHLDSHPDLVRQRAHVFEALKPGSYLLVLYRPSEGEDSGDDTFLSHEIQIGAGEGIDLDLGEEFSLY